MPGYIHTCASCGAHMQVHERYLGRNLRCTSCRTEFLAALPEGIDVVEAPPTSQASTAPPRGRVRRIAWIALFMVFAMVGLWWLGQEHRGDPLFRPERAAGEIGVLRSEGPGAVVVALDRDSVNRLVKAGDSPSSPDARAVVEEGHGLEVAAGTQVRILERANRGRESRVRILDGPWASRVVWVPSRWVW